MRRFLAVLPAPLLIGALAFALLWWAAKQDAAIEQRFREQDRQDSVATVQTQQIAAKHRAALRADTLAAREAAKIDRQRQQERRSLAVATATADSLRGTVDSLLGTLPTERAKPLVDLITSQQVQIQALAALVDLAQASDSIHAAGEVRWRNQALDWKASSATWQRQAESWEREAKRDHCPKVLGVLPVPEVGVGVGATWANGRLQSGPTVAALVPIGCIV